MIYGNFKTRNIKGATLLAAALSCVLPRAGDAAVPPPQEPPRQEKESAKPAPERPVMLAALPPSASVDPWASQSMSPFILAALPSPELTPSEVVSQKPVLSPAEAAEAAKRQEPSWMLPQVRLGGRLSYLRRGDKADTSSSNQQGLMASLIGHVNAPVWQPWFGSLNGEIEYGWMRSDTTGYGAGSSTATTANSSSKMVNEKAQLMLLPRSKFPFEAHVDRTDSRSLGSLSALDAYVSQRVGFTQNINMEGGGMMFGWDGRSQNSDTQLNPLTGLPGVEYRQRELKMSLSKYAGQRHRFFLNGGSQSNTQENTDQMSEQRNWSAKHNYYGDAGLVVDTMADTAWTESRMLQPTQTPGLFNKIDTESQQRQFNSMAIWNPGNEALTMNGAVRVMELDNSIGSTGVGLLAPSVQMRTVNLNAGAAYVLSKNIKLNGSANANLTSSEVAQNTTQQKNTSETAGISYQSDSIPVGDYQYAMSGNGSFSNRNGDTGNSGKQFTGSFGHNLNRSFSMSQSAALTTNVSQSVTAIQDSVLEESRQLTHTGLLAWNDSRGDMTTLLQLNGSDTRTWGLNEGVFQMANFQATGNWVTGYASSWSANLTVQKTRTDRRVVQDTNQPSGVNVVYATNTITTSHGTVSYQNQSLFGVYRLLFNSDLRLSSQALLPVLGGPDDQDVMAWENRLEYAVGRMHLRFNVRQAKNGSTMNRTYLFTLTRDFGDI